MSESSPVAGTKPAARSGAAGDTHAVPSAHGGALPDLVGSLTRHWILVAVIAAGVTAGAWLFVAAQPKRYQTSAIAAISPRVNDLSVSETFHGVDTLERRVVVATVAALASTPLTLQQAGVRSNESVEALVIPTTNLFRINVEGPDAQRAARLANAIPAHLSVQAGRMYRVYAVSVVSPAPVPRSPALPRTERAVIGGLLGGVVLGAAAAWLLDSVRRPKYPALSKSS